MNLYLISQNWNNNYDTYDSAVVAAPNEKIARATHPNSAGTMIAGTWVEAKHVTVKLIGVAAEGIEQGVICASFNAG